MRRIQWDKPWILELSLLLVVFSWGVNHVIVKAALDHMEPLAFNALRLIIAAIALVIIFSLSDGNWQVRRADYKPMLLLGLVGHSIYQLFFITGLNLTTAGKTAIIMATVPTAVALLGAMTRQEKYSPQGWTGIMTSLAGVYLVTSAGTAIGGGFNPGDLLIVGGVICWATYTAFSRPLFARYTPLKFTTIGMVVGIIPLLIVAGPSLQQLPWSSIPLTAYLSVIFSALTALVFGYLIWAWGIQRIGSGRTAIYSNLTPLITSITGWIFLQESWAMWQLVGAGLILLGVNLVRRGARVPKAQPASRSVS